MVQSEQIKHLAGHDIAGNEVYVSQSSVNDLLTEARTAPIKFTVIEANADSFFKLDATTVPANKPLYIDGTNDKNNLGGIAVSKVAALGVNDLTANKKGEVTLNLVEILDTNHDELMDGDRIIYGLLQTTDNEGDTINGANCQLSFVKYDKVTKAFIPYSMVSGDYYYEPREVTSLGGLAAKGGLLPEGLAGRGDYGASAVDGVAKDLGEIVVSATVDLPDTIVKVTNDGTVTSLTDSAGTAIPTTTVNMVNAYNQKVTGGAGLAYQDGLEVVFNGVSVPRTNVTFESATSLSVDLKDTMFGKKLYKDTRIEIEVGL